MDSSCGGVQNQPDAKSCNGSSVRPSVPSWMLLGASATKRHTKISKFPYVQDEIKTFCQLPEAAAGSRQRTNRKPIEKQTTQQTQTTEDQVQQH